MLAARRIARPWVARSCTKRNRDAISPPSVRNQAVVSPQSVRNQRTCSSLSWRAESAAWCADRNFSSRRCSCCSLELSSCCCHAAMPRRNSSRSVLACTACAASAISSTQWHSIALNRTRWHAVALSGTKWHSVAISGTQRHSVARAWARSPPPHVACDAPHAPRLAPHRARHVTSPLPPSRLPRR